MSACPRAVLLGLGLQHRQQYIHTEPFSSAGEWHSENCCFPSLERDFSVLAGDLDFSKFFRIYFKCLDKFETILPDYFSVFMWLTVCSSSFLYPRFCQVCFNPELL